MVSSFNTVCQCVHTKVLQHVRLSFVCFYRAILKFSDNFPSAFVERFEGRWKGAVKNER